MSAWTSNARFKAHPKQILADGTKAVSVTTALSELAKPALIRWANNMGLKGIDTTKYVDEKAKAGSLAHAMILADLAGIKPDLREYTQHELDQAENSYLKFLEWQKKHKLEPIFCEKGFVSERYRYGGIIDCYCRLDGTLTMLDFKTGKAIYDEMWFQVAAYGQMLKEMGHPVEEYRILQIGRDESENSSEQYRKTLDDQFEVFLHALSIYNLKKKIKGE